MSYTEEGLEIMAKFKAVELIFGALLDRLTKRMGYMEYWQIPIPAEKYLSLKYDFDDFADLLGDTPGYPNELTEADWEWWLTHGNLQQVNNELAKFLNNKTFWWSIVAKHLNGN